jgi:hypothetical protein
METIPDRASNAGPEESNSRDWYEWLDEARDTLRDAMRMGQQHTLAAVRIRLIKQAREALDSAIELLEE